MGKGSKAVNPGSDGGKGERARSEDKGKGKWKAPGPVEGKQGSANRVRSREPQPASSSSSTTAKAIPAPAQPGPKLEQQQKATQPAAPPVQPKKSPPARRPRSPPRQDFTLPTGDTDEEGDPNPQAAKKGKQTVESAEAQWVTEANAFLDQKMAAMGTACSGIIQKACEEITAFSESTLKKSVRLIGGILREEMEDIKARLTPPTMVSERVRKEYAEPSSKASAAKKPRVDKEAQDQGKGEQVGSETIPTTQKAANKIPNAKDVGASSSVDPTGHSQPLPRSLSQPRRIGGVQKRPHPLHEQGRRRSSFQVGSPEDVGILVLFAMQQVELKTPLLLGCSSDQSSQNAWQSPDSKHSSRTTGP